MIYLNGASTKRMEWYNSNTKVICVSGLFGGLFMQPLYYMAGLNWHATKEME